MSEFEEINKSVKEKNPIVNEKSSSNGINSCFASQNSKVNDIHQLFDNKDIIDK